MELTRPRLVVGLGNPGSEYEATRHNIGFMVIDRLLAGMRRGGEPLHTNDSLVWDATVRGQRIHLQKLLTFMNLSGRAVAGFARREELAPDEVLVVYDDADLPLGRLRIRRKGSSGGHRGIESIIAELGTSRFPRLRVGIGRHENGGDMVSHVLAPFEADEEGLLERVIDAAQEAAMLCVRQDVVAAMNRFNGMNVDDSSENAQTGDSED